MSSMYGKNLFNTVLESSSNKSWNEAVLEWEIDDVIEDEYNEATCICGKENIRYLYTIKNVINHQKLYPIGSSCIKKFDRKDLNELTTIKEKLFKLFHAIKANEFIELNSVYFSRKLLKYLYGEGAFEPNQYNKYNGLNDYDFMLDMFNMKGKPSPNQSRKITAIIMTSIKPYLVYMLNNRTKYNSFN